MLFERINVLRTETRSYETCLYRTLSSMWFESLLCLKQQLGCLHSACSHEVCLIHGCGIRMSLSKFFVDICSILYFSAVFLSPKQTKKNSWDSWDLSLQSQILKEKWYFLHCDFDSCLSAITQLLSQIKRSIRCPSPCSVKWKTRWQRAVVTSKYRCVI